MWEVKKFYWIKSEAQYHNEQNVKVITTASSEEAQEKKERQNEIQINIIGFSDIMSLTLLSLLPI
jgi:hypothetical protein